MYLIIGKDCNGKAVVFTKNNQEINDLILSITGEMPNSKAEYAAVHLDALETIARANAIVGDYTYFNDKNIALIADHIGKFNVDIPITVHSDTYDDLQKTGSIGIREHGVSIGFEDYVEAMATSREAKDNDCIFIRVGEHPDVFIRADATDENTTTSVCLNQAHIDALPAEDTQLWLDKYQEALETQISVSAEYLKNGWYFHSIEHDRKIGHFEYGLAQHGVEAIQAYAEYKIDPSCYVKKDFKVPGGCSDINKHREFEINSTTCQLLTAFLSKESIQRRKPSNEFFMLALNASIAASFYAYGDTEQLFSVIEEAVNRLRSDYFCDLGTEKVPVLLLEYINELDKKKSVAERLDNLEIGNAQELQAPIEPY